MNDDMMQKIRKVQKEYVLCHGCETVTHVSQSFDAYCEETGEDVVICKRCAGEVTE